MNRIVVVLKYQPDVCKLGYLSPETRTGPGVAVSNATLPGRLISNSNVLTQMIARYWCRSTWEAVRILDPFVDTANRQEGVLGTNARRGMPAGELERTRQGSPRAVEKTALQPTAAGRGKHEAWNRSQLSLASFNQSIIQSAIFVRLNGRPSGPIANLGSLGSF